MRFLELDKEALLEYVKTQEQKETILNAFLAVYTGGVPTRRMIGNIKNSEFEWGLTSHYSYPRDKNGTPLPPVLQRVTLHVYSDEFQLVYLHFIVDIEDSLLRALKADLAGVNERLIIARKKLMEEWHVIS